MGGFGIWRALPAMRRGFAPNPTRGSAPLNLAKGTALGTIHFGAGMGGANGDLAWSRLAPPIPAPMDRLQRASPFAGLEPRSGSRGQSPWRVRGRSPRDSRPSRSNTTPAIRGAAPAATHPPPSPAPTRRDRPEPPPAANIAIPETAASAVRSAVPP